MMQQENEFNQNKLLDEPILYDNSGQVYLNSFEKTILMMKNNEWSVLDSYLKNASKIDFDIDTIDEVSEILSNSKSWNI